MTTENEDDVIFVTVVLLEENGRREQLAEQMIETGYITKSDYIRNTKNDRVNDGDKNKIK